MDSAGAVGQGAGPAGPDARLAESVQCLGQVLSRVRARMLERVRHDRQWSAQALIHALVVRGPMRSSELAEALHADPSTISRQVAALVRDGLVVREGDPVDGRVCLLRASEKAGAVVAEHAAIRDRHLARMLATWGPADKARLADLLERFTADLQDYASHLGQYGWTEEPVESAPAPRRTPRG